MKLLTALLALTFAVSQADAARYLPAISVAIAAAETERTNPQPSPDNSTECENCNGTGKVGDGTVFVNCPVCDGTGKKSSLPALPELPDIAVLKQQPTSEPAHVWNAQEQKWYTTNGQWCASPGGQWEAVYRTVTIPAQYRTETYRQKVCSGGRCSYVNRTRQVLVAPARTVRVKATSTPVVDASLSPDQQATPPEGVDAGLRALNPQPHETFVEFGCGYTAPWAIKAVEDYGVQRAFGIEIDPKAAESARRRVAQAGLEDRIRIITGDATTTNVQADIGVAYLWPETLAQLRPQIQKLDRFVSFGHDVPGLTLPQRGDLFVYQRPQPVRYVQRPAGAVWGGRVYSGPVCSNPRCSMCRSIRAQLASM